jgi:hypothetical protein
MNTESASGCPEFHENSKMDTDLALLLWVLFFFSQLTLFPLGSQTRNRPITADFDLQPSPSHSEVANPDVVACPLYGVDPCKLSISGLGHSNLHDASREPTGSDLNLGLDFNFGSDHNLDLEAYSSLLLDPYVNFITTPQDELAPIAQQQRQASRFSCSQPGCSKTFSRKDCLTRHENGRAHSLVWGLHMCPIAGCRMNRGEGFSRRDKVKEHLYKQHADLGYTKGNI